MQCHSDKASGLSPNLCSSTLYSVTVQHELNGHLPLLFLWNGIYPLLRRNSLLLSSRPDAVICSLDIFTGDDVSGKRLGNRITQHKTNKKRMMRCQRLEKTVAYRTVRFNAKQSSLLTKPIFCFQLEY